MKNIFANPQKSALVVLLILISALTIRLYNLNKYDLWFDEASTIRFFHENIERRTSLSGLPAATIIFEQAQKDPHPFFYYLLIYACSFLLKGWWSLRLLSVVFSVLSLFIFYKFARLIYDHSTSLLAVLLMAISPFQVWYAQEMRVYAVSEFFALLAVLFFVKILKNGGKKYWVYFLIAEIFAILTSYYSFFLLLAAFGFLLFKHKFANLKRIILFITAVFALCSPFLAFFLIQVNSIKDYFWLRPPVIKNIFLSFAAFGLGYSANYQQLIIGSTAIFALFARGVYRSIKDKNDYAFFLLGSFFLPLLLVYLVSKFGLHIYIDRQFIVITPFYYLFIAYGITSLRNVKLKLLVCVALIVFMACLLGNYYSGFMLSSGGRRDFYPGVHERKQSRSLLDYLYSNFENGDLAAATDIQSYSLAGETVWKFGSHKSYWLLFYPATIHSVERYAFGGEFSGFLRQIKAEGNESFLHAVHYSNSRRLVVEKEPFADKAFKRIWLITSSWDKVGLSPVNYNHEKIKGLLSNDYKCVEFMKKDGVLLEIFEKK